VSTRYEGPNRFRGELERVTIELGERSPADGDDAMTAELRRQ